jgi:RNA polymerase sigma-70 factor (ECF subfamily)
MGDKKAYALLIKRYYTQVFMVCLGILGNEHDAEEIAQEAMLKGFTQIKKLEDASRFGPWIVAITKNLCINLIHRNQLSRQVVENITKPASSEPNDNDDLMAAIEKLSEDLRIPLLMYYFDGQNGKAVAEKLNLPAAKVYSMLREALIQLQVLMLKQRNIK